MRDGGIVVTPIGLFLVTLAWIALFFWLAKTDNLGSFIVGIWAVIFLSGIGRVAYLMARPFLT